MNFLTVRHMKLFAGAFPALLCLLASACTTNPASLDAGDPFEPLNRKIYAFNTAVDTAAIAPASRAYVAVTPGFARTGLRNAMGNLNEPVVFANTLLQGKLGASARTALRFGLNSTIGLAGLVDVASREGIAAEQGDFGQTLGVWGVGPGPYLMLPLLGPSSVRDGVGRWVDRYPYPLSWNEQYDESGWHRAAQAATILDIRAQLDPTLRRLEETAIDPYVQIRSGYLQQRAARTGGTQAEDYQALPDFDG